MQASNWDFQTTSKDDDEPDLTEHKSSQDSADRFGIQVSLLILCVALFVAALWFASRPNFEKCIALTGLTERDACYEQLRTELFKPPAR